MKKRGKRKCPYLPKRAGAVVLSLAMAVTGLQYGSLTALGAEPASAWKGDVTAALDEMDEALSAADDYAEAKRNLTDALDGLEPSVTVENFKVTSVGEHEIIMQWDAAEVENLVGYNVYWADKDLETTKFQLLGPDGKLAERMSGDLDENGKKNPAPELTIAAEDAAGQDVIEFKADFSTFKNNYFKVALVLQDGMGTKSPTVKAPTAVEYQAVVDDLGRGLVAVQKADGVFLNWRILWDELDGGTFKDENGQGLTGVNFNIYRNNQKIATVSNSTNYLDTEVKSGLTADMYRVVPVGSNGQEIAEKAGNIYQVLTSDSSNPDTAYLEFTTYKPEEISIGETYGITEAKSQDVKDIITYNTNDASVMDVDGDGEYEVIVEWNPRYAKDVSQWGYTGKQMLDCYKLDGTLLWRVDLGINIRSGAHYTEFIAYDFEGDGRGELVLKTAPGSKVYQFELGPDGKNVMENGYPKVKEEHYITIPAEDAAEGVSNDSNFVYSNEDYREHLIEMFMDWGVWSNYPEQTRELGIIPYWPGNVVECFTVDPNWGDKAFYTGGATNEALNIAEMTTEQIQSYVPGYKEGDKLVIVATQPSQNKNADLKTVLVEDVKNYNGGYDLASVDKDVTGKGYTREEAVLLTDYYMNHFGYTNGRHDINTFEGFILSGPEYLTLFDGRTGAELDTQKYHIGREDDGMIWGDYGWRGGVEPGNRVDRYNATVTYLDGETPSAVFGRGYYARTAFEAWNVVDGKLKFVGSIDSGAQPMENPFNDSGKYKDGVDPVNGKLSGQGQHYITSADVNLDGRQEIVNGGAIVGYDMESGSLYLYNSGGDYIGGDESKGWKKHYHGDMMHITDIDPDLPGIEIGSCFEGGGGPWDWAVRSLYTNNVLFGEFNGKDTARFTIGDIRGDVRGIEIPAGGGRTAEGKPVSLTSSGSNHSLRWSADMTTQFVDGEEGKNIRIFGQGKDYVKAAGYTANNSTKGNPSLTADVFGDYRDEMIVRSMDSTKLRIYMNTEVSQRKLYTPMQNLQYRAHVAGQNSSYNMPAYVDYYFAADTDWEYVTVPNRKADQAPGAVVESAANYALAARAAGTTVSADGEAQTAGANEGKGILADTGKVTVYTGSDAEVAGKMVSPLEKYQFDFGNKEGNAGEPFTTITTQTYDSEKGYGYVNDVSGIQVDKSNSGGIVIPENPTEYDRARMKALTDSVRHGSAIEFGIDLPAGEYMLSAYVADDWNNGAYIGTTYSVNGVEFGKYTASADADKSGTTNGISKPAEEWGYHARIVLDEASQIIVKADRGSGLRGLSAITIGEFIEKVDPFDAQEWQDLKDNMANLRAKMRLFADNSTPFDYDAALVNKLTAVQDAVEAAKYMPLVDVKPGDKTYAQASVEVTENKAMYTEATVEKLKATMDAYDGVKEKLDVRADLDNLQETIAFWLIGVDTDIEKVYSRFFDFDLGTSNYLASGWTSVGQQVNNPYLTSYEETEGYGFLSVSPGRNRGKDDPVLNDWASGVVFAVDLEAGKYAATVFTGESSGTAKDVWHSFYTNYELGSGEIPKNSSGTGSGNKIAGSESAIKASTNGYVTTRYEFTLEEPTQVVFEGNAYIQALVVEEYIPASVTGYDIETLKQLLTDVDFENLTEEEYTVASWESLASANKAAAEAVERGQLTVQEAESLYNNLYDAWKGLVLRSGVIAYNIDFGPREDSTTGTPQLETNGQSGTQFGAEAVAGAERPAFQLGHGDMLYADNKSNEGLHWGFDKVVPDGDSGAGGAYFRDWVYAPDNGSTPYTFMADLPTGDYFVFVYTGVKSGSANTTKLMFHNEIIKSTNPVTEVKDDKTVYVQQYNTGGQYPYDNSLYYVRVEENKDALSTLPRLKMGTLSITVFDDTNASERTGCINGLEIFPVRLDGAGELPPEEKKQVTIEGVTVNSKTYDAAPAATIGDPVIKHSGVTVTAPTALVYTYTSTDGGGYSANIPPVNAGAYQLVISVADTDNNYEGSSAPIAFTISKAPVIVGPKTVVVDVADVSGGDVSGGDAIPRPELGYSGLAGNDTIEPSETPVFTHNAGDGMTPGTYTYTWVNSDVSFLRADNYEITRIPTGQLIIQGSDTPQPQAVTVSGVGFGSHVYDGTPAVPEGKPVAMLDSQDVTASIETFTYAYTGVEGTVYEGDTAPADAGIYQLVITAADADGLYEGSSDPVRFVIDRRPVTVGPKAVTIQKGEAIPEFTLEYVGLLGGDTLVPSAEPLFATNASDSNTAGDFTITWTNMTATTFGGNDNYVVTDSGRTATAILRIEDSQAQTVDKSELAGYLEQLKQENLKEDDYTAESWTAFRNAQIHANTVLATEGFTQEEVEEALGRLKAAREALAEDPDKDDDGSGDDSTGSDPADHSGSTGIGTAEEDLYGYSSQAVNLWSMVNTDLKDKNNSGSPYTRNILTGRNIIVPNTIVKTLQDGNGNLAMHTGAGVTFSISAADIPQNRADGSINLTVNSGSVKIPADQLKEKTAGAAASRQISMADRGSFGMNVNMHFSLGKENAEKYANLYYYNETSGRLEYLGSYHINSDGQAMFGITGGADFLLTVTDKKPAEKAVSMIRAAGGYTVQRGDTLGRIAAVNRIPAAQILTLNPQIRNANMIYPGQTIRLR